MYNSSIHTMQYRIGFCCKYIDNAEQVNGFKPNDPAKKYNTGTTTVAWLSRQNRSVAEQKLWDLMKSNIEATKQLVAKVSTLDPHLRMVRLSSDILPVYTHADWKYFWQQSDVKQYCERHFATIGEIARYADVRLSFHPGQFCVLASENPNIVENSIEEFEYHADMARMMGYGSKFQDFKINVHTAGKLGTPGVRKAYQRLSSEARNMITIENEEMSYGLDDVLDLVDLLPIVLDVHHHWIKTGEYIEATDSRIAMVTDSWRDVRPVIHYSVSREDVLVEHTRHERPTLSSLIESGHKKQKLRAHSDFYWNKAVNEWALSHLSWTDIQCESKAKNLASLELFNQLTKN